MGFLNKYRFDKVANAPDNNFIPFEIGENKAWIEDVKECVSKNGNDMLVVTFRSSHGGQIKEYFTDSEITASKLKQLQTAFGIELGEQDTRRWRGKKGIVVCKEERYNGNVYPRICHYRPLNNAPRPPVPENNSQKEPGSPGSMGDIPF